MTKKDGQAANNSTTPAGKERRSAVRHPCKVESICQITSAREAGTWPARIVDLSTGGLGLFLSHRFEPRTKLTVTLRAAKSTRILDMHVVHVSELARDCFLIGTALDTELSAEDLADLLP